MANQTCKKKQKNSKNISLIVGRQYKCKAKQKKYKFGEKAILGKGKVFSIVFIYLTYPLIYWPPCLGSIEFRKASAIHSWNSCYNQTGFDSIILLCK